MGSLNSTEKQFNFDALKLDIGFGNGLPEKKEITSILVRRPPKQTYIRVNPDPEWQLSTAVLELKEEGETYLVARDLWEELADEIVPKILVSCLTRQNTFFFWPIRLPNKQGWVDSWNRSAIECVKLGHKQWIRIVSNKDAQSYDALVAENQDNLPDPTWPESDFQTLLKQAFKDHYIDSKDHPVLKKLRGVL